MHNEIKTDAEFSVEKSYNKDNQFLRNRAGAQRRKLWII